MVLQRNPHVSVEKTVLISGREKPMSAAHRQRQHCKPTKSSESKTETESLFISSYVPLKISPFCLQTTPPTTATSTANPHQRILVKKQNFPRKQENFSLFSLSFSLPNVWIKEKHRGNPTEIFQKTIFFILISNTQNLKIRLFFIRPIQQHFRSQQFGSFFKLLLRQLFQLLDLKPNLQNSLNFQSLSP